MQEIIIGWTVYKLHWEKTNQRGDKYKGDRIVGTEPGMSRVIDDMVGEGYKINSIDFIYTREG